MAISITESGARISRGRGAGAVSLDVSFRELEQWARRNRVDTPRIMRISFGRACSGLKKQLAAIMQHGGGINGVPKFSRYERITEEMRIARGVDPSGPIGGVLANRKAIKAWKRNGWQVIGWPDDIDWLAKKFQSGTGGRRDKFKDEDFREHIHRRFGIKDVPRAYVHNERQVIEPYFHEHVAEKLDDWADNIFYKELARQMQKSGALGI